MNIYRPWQQFCIGLPTESADLQAQGVVETLRVAALRRPFGNIREIDEACSRAYRMS